MICVPPCSFARLAVQPTSGQELLEFVRDAHRAIRESIQTLSCRVEFKGVVTSTGKDQSCSGRFWYSADAVRANFSQFGKETDYVWEDSVRREVIRDSFGGKPVVGATRSRLNSRYIARCDAWVSGLLVLNLPNTSQSIPFEQLVSKATRLKGVEKRSVKDRETIIVRLFFDGTNDWPAKWDVEIHFDPQVNYLVSKIIGVATDSNGRYRREDEVLQFKECAPGLYFPERLAGRSGRDGNFDFNHTTTISEIRVNQPLPDGVFRFRYPHGIYLTDSIRGTSYRVDPDGNRIGPETPLGTVPPLAAGEELERGSESVEEPKTITRWILPVSIGVLALAGVAAVVRRWRRATTAD